MSNYGLEEINIIPIVCAWKFLFSKSLPIINWLKKETILPIKVAEHSLTVLIYVSKVVHTSIFFY